MFLREIIAPAGEPKLVGNGNALLLCGDTFAIMDNLYAQGIQFPLIFSDPPYFLSNGGITCHAGRVASVDKGVWDKNSSFFSICNFHRLWIKKCLSLLTPNGSMWISATQHSLFIIGYILQEMDCSIINCITWEKPNPPPNISCRYFTHSTEMLIWVKRNKKARHCFHYETMKELNQGRQMKTVWCIAPPQRQEKIFGHHPTQKPVELLRRILLASSNPGDVVFDPFAGSSTTGVAALQLNRQFIGIEQEKPFIELSIKRLTSEYACLAHGITGL